MHSILACHFIGVSLTVLFYGITLGQTWFYFRTFQKDPLAMRLLVGLLWLLDTAQLVLVVQSLYDYTILWRGDILALECVSKQFEASMAVTSIVAFIVQLIYAYRIWRLSFNGIWLTVSIILLALCALASGGAMVAKTVRDPRWDHTSASNTPASLILASTVACDAVIAASQVYLFRRSSCGQGRLESVISKLTVLVVNVGLLTSIDVTVFLILFLACPLNGMFIVPYLLFSNCYLNSFLSVLNSRKLLRTIADNNIDDVYASIFDVHMNGDITIPTCRASLALMGTRDFRTLPAPVLPLVSFGRGTFSIEEMGVQSYAVG